MPAKKLTCPPSAGKAKKGGKTGGKRKRLHRQDGYSTYIRKVLKQVHPAAGISKQGMNVMNSMTLNAFERLMSEATRLAAGKKTITVRDVQAAVRLCLPGELAKHAISEGTKAVAHYNAH